MGHRSLPVRTALSVLLLASAAARAEPVEVQFCGYAYDLKDGHYRYTERHKQTHDGDRWRAGTIDYIAADGKPIGHKSLSFESNRFVPVYRLELFGGRYVEGIESVAADHVSAFRKKFGDDELDREEVEYSAPAAADSGFHSLIRANLPALLKGARASFQFIVAGALDAYKFRVRRGAATRTFEGRPAVQLIAEADSLLRLVAPDLDLTYDPATGQLLEYRGRSNLVEADDGGSFDVRIIYTAHPPGDAPAASVSGCS